MDSYNLWKRAMSTKARLLIEKSRVISEVAITPEMELHYDYETLNRLINTDLINSLSKEVMKNFSMHITEEPINDQMKKKKIDLMVVPTDSFKIVIEEVIRLMPQNVIDEIRRLCH